MANLPWPGLDKRRVGGYTPTMATDDSDAPLVRLTPTRSNDRAARAGVAAVLLWVFDPGRRALLVVVGGLGIFGGGLWAGRALERRSGPGDAIAASAGPGLAAPVSTMAIQRPPAAPPSAAQAAPSSLMQFSGQWVGAEATPPAEVDRLTAAPFEAETTGHEIDGPGDQARAPKGVLTPKTFESPGAPRAPKTPATSGAPSSAAKAAGSGASPAGAKPQATTPLSRVPGIGTAVEVKVTPEMAKGMADRQGQFGAQAPAGQRLMTTEAGVNPIGIDRARAFGIFEGKGPHDGTTPSIDPGAGIGGAELGGPDSGGPTKINLGGRLKSGGADR